MNEGMFTLTENCRHGSRKPCSCSCPVNFDVSDFIKKLSAGSIKSAQRALASALVFPGLVCELCSSPCAAACIYGIDLRQLERSCDHLMASATPPRYSAPKQKYTVAIVGAGLSGLACAQKLASKNYNVTVIERSEEIGGTLIEIFGAERCDAEFKRQFAYAPFVLENKEVSSADELAAFDAVYIATGKAGSDFGLMYGWNPQSKATGKTGFFLGGELTGGDKMAALADGIVAAASIEYYLRSGRMDGEPSKFIDASCQLTGQRPQEPLRPSDKLLSKEELIQAAKQCRLCDCNLCSEGCEFLKWFGLGPRKLEESMKNAQAKSTGLCDRQGTRAAYSCSLCGHCENVCPEGIGFEKLMLETKQSLYENGYFPEVLHDHFIQDMLTAQTKDFLCLLPPGYEKARYMLFPGCQECKTAPEHVLRAYDYLLNLHPDSALMMGCCGVPALWAGNKALFSDILEKVKREWTCIGCPTAVLMCPTCAKTFREYLPEIKFISIYELLDRNGLPTDAFPSPGEYSVFDPCSSAGFPEFQASVRSIGEKLAYKVTEMPNSKATARCCGMGGHVYPTNRKVAVAALKAASEESPLEYICYCANCRTLFVLNGKACRHILDDVFGIDPLASPIHLEQMEINRSVLKSALMEQYLGVQFASDSNADKTKLIISEALHRKMDENLISASKIKELLRICESEQARIYIQERGTYIAHKKLGNITYWAEYVPEEDNAFRIVNAYCHKMSVHG